MKKIKSWFTTPERPGHRTLDQQLRGLDGLAEHCATKTVLDVGCAEGFIAHHLSRHGAGYVHGVEIVPGYVQIANSIAARERLQCVFEVGDANAYRPHLLFDVVLMLAILHKLRDPSAACARFARSARDLCVLRLPPSEAPWVVVDSRSGRKPHDIDAVMHNEGFGLDRVTRSRFDEWVGYYARA